VIHREIWEIREDIHREIREIRDIHREIREIREINNR
jgi:hypothetical protein